MGILIKQNCTSSELANSYENDFIPEEYYQMLRMIVGFKEKLDNLKVNLEEKEKQKETHFTKIQSILEEQKKIDTEIRKILDSKNLFYQDVEISFVPALNFAKANDNLNNLVSKLKSLDAKLTIVSNNLRQTVKSINTIRSEKQMLEEKISVLEKVLQNDFKKINWNGISNATIFLSNLFELVKDEKTEILLKKIFRKNSELEKIIIKIIHKISSKLINGCKSQKLIVMMDEVDALIGINNKIYEFIYELITTNNISPEISELLKELENLLDHLEVSAKTSLSKDKLLDISTAIKSIKNIAELKRKTVMQNFRPIILNMKKIEDYEAGYAGFSSIVDEIDTKFSNLKKPENSKEKVYILN